MVVNCRIWYFEKLETNLRGTMEIWFSKIWQRVFRNKQLLFVVLISKRNVEVSYNILLFAYTHFMKFY